MSIHFTLFAFNILSANKIPRRSAQELVVKSGLEMRKTIVPQLTVLLSFVEL